MTFFFFFLQFMWFTVFFFFKIMSLKFILLYFTYTQHNLSAQTDLFWPIIHILLLLLLFLIYQHQLQRSAAQILTSNDYFIIILFLCLYFITVHIVQWFRNVVDHWSELMKRNECFLWFGEIFLFIWWRQSSQQQRAQTNQVKQWLVNDLVTHTIRQCSYPSQIFDLHTYQ